MIAQHLSLLCASPPNPTAPTASEGHSAVLFNQTGGDYPSLRRTQYP